MKQKVIMVVIAIVLLGAGATAGFFVANSKSKAAIADMEAKMQQAQTEAQTRIRGYDMIIENLNGQLQIAQLEIQTYKSQLPTEAEALAATEPTKAAAAKTTTAKPAAATIQYESPDGPTGNSTDNNTKIYTIKSGDSLWSIAQKQLSDGNRYKEILKLNPKISAKSNLVVGSKLKLPSK